MWDNRTPSKITRARLLRMTPERVYDELKDYGAHLDGSVWCGDDDLEHALYGRSDELINLGLAQFGTNRKVASALYQQSFVRTRDTEYGHAIRLAVLANSGLAQACQYVGNRAPVDRNELLRLAATAGTDHSDELVALLRNPGARALLSSLFNRDDPFDQVAAEHFHWMLAVASQNHCINQDDGDHPWSSGPDLTAYHMQQGIWTLMRSLPVSEDALEALYMLLDSLELRRVYVPDEDPTPAIMRWRSVTQRETLKKKHSRHRYTTLDYAEEFCCLAAALYRQWYDRSGKDAKIVYIGSANSPDLILRCAYYSSLGHSASYGTAALTADQMEQAHNKDGAAFTLAALCNAQLVRNPATRAAFEHSMMLKCRRTPNHDFGNNCALQDLYHRRCKEMPGAEALAGQNELPSTPEQAAMAKIESEFTSLAAALGQRLNTESVKTWWVLALLLLLLIVLWSRR